MRSHCQNLDLYSVRSIIVLRDPSSPTLEVSRRPGFVRGDVAGGLGFSSDMSSHATFSELEIWVLLVLIEPDFVLYLALAQM